MSDDRDPPSAARPSVRAGRPSLKELAERVSKTPPPPSVRAPDVAPVSASAPLSAPATKVSPPPSAAERISAVPTSVRPPVAPISITHVEPVPSIAKTAPIDAAPVVAAANDASPVSKGPKTLAAGTAPTKSSNTLWIAIGGGVVALAAAASIALYLNSKKAPAADQTAANAKTETAATAEVMTAAPAAPKDDAAPEVVQNDTPPPPSGVDLDSIGDATDSASPMFTGRLPVASSTPIATNDEKDETKDGPHRIEPNGTLDEAMRDAAGPADENKGQKPASTPTGPKNLPDTPPNGSVSAAIGSVRGAARGCVAGADKDSSATIVFGSSGAVQSVSVGGWAAGKPAAGCIQGAVSGARVEPFTKPSFPVTMTIRP